MKEEIKVDEFEFSRAKRKVKDVRFKALREKRELDPNLIGFASFVYDDALLIESVMVKRFGNTYQVSLPYRLQRATGRMNPYISTRNFEVTSAIEEAVIGCVEEFLVNNQLNFEV